ncbi:MTH1187 family thiamine-binding protein [bacterium]|nr:MTH1187 family thiamine-binding protein [bacterium]
MAVVEIAVAHIGTEPPNLSRYVAECESVLEKYKDLKHKLTPMATVIEGDFARILEAIKEMHKVPFKLGVKRVVTHITIDERIDKKLNMKGKNGSVKKKKENESWHIGL